jgi:hypothetical protein
MTTHFSLRLGAELDRQLHLQDGWLSLLRGNIVLVGWWAYD